MIDMEKLKLVLKNVDDEEYHSSILDIIKRSDDENFITKIITYVFREHPEILSSFLGRIYNEKITIREIEECVNELMIDNGQRIDLFMEARDDNDDKVIIVIENKIWSSEHSDQCRNYRRFMLEKHNNVKNKYFIYLKPRTNVSMPNCEGYVIATYDNLLEALENYDGHDYVIDDLKNTIKNNLMEKDMNELERLLLSNYPEINNGLKSAKNKADGFFEGILKRFNEENGDIYNYENEGTSYRLYLRDKWWSGYCPGREDEQFYFYLEIFWKGFDPNGIVVQQTVKIYRRDGGSIIDGFKEYYLNEKKTNRTTKFDWWVVNGADDSFKSKHKCFTSEWKDEFVKWSMEKLYIYAEDQKELFNRFIAYKSR